MPKLVARFSDVASHTDVDDAFFVISLEMHAKESFACPIEIVFVLFWHVLDEMGCIVAIGVLMTEFIENEVNMYRVCFVME